MPRFTFSEDWLCRLRDLKLNIKERQPLKKTMVETIFNKTTWFQGESFMGQFRR
jgi:hypothetical protein